MEFSAAFRPHGERMGTAGDRRILTSGQAAHLISVEFAMPRAVLVVVSIQDADTPGAQANGLVHIVSGLDRSISDDETFTSTGVNRAILARSIQVTVTNPSGGVTARIDVRAVCVPLDVTVPTSLFGSSLADPGRPLDTSVDSIYGTPDAGYNAVAQSATAVVIAAPADVPKGVAVYNNADSNLFLKLWSGSGTGGSVNATSDFTVRLVPQAYYEVPFGFTGAIVGIWSGAGSGTANVTFLRS